MTWQQDLLEYHLRGDRLCLNEEKKLALLKHADERGMKLSHGDY
jgi:hypothetical protein